MRPRIILSSIVIASALACGSPAPNVESSGDEAFDQTAAFVRWAVHQAQMHGLEDPVEIVQWMCSTSGSATLTPPSPDLEPDMAEVYAGPRPHDEVSWGCADRNPMFPKHIAVQADDVDRRILASAFERGKAAPVHVWEWRID